jgi:hypothetical protein
MGCKRPAGGGLHVRWGRDGIKIIFERTKTTAARREVGARAIEKSRDSQHLIRHHQTAKRPAGGGPFSLADSSHLAIGGELFVDVVKCRVSADACVLRHRKELIWTDQIIGQTFSKLCNLFQRGEALGLIPLDIVI